MFRGKIPFWRYSSPLPIPKHKSVWVFFILHASRNFLAIFSQFSRNFLAIFLQFSEKAVKKRFICRFSDAFRIIRDCLGKAEQFLKTAFVYPSDLLKSLDIINFFKSSITRYKKAFLTIFSQISKKSKIHL